MNSDSPQILRLTWPVVFGLLAMEFFALAMVFGLYWFLTQVGPPANADEIRRVLDDQVAAWNRGDLEGYMAGYWHDERLQFFGGGDVTKGWQPTLDRYRRKYQGDGKEMGHLTFADVDVRPIASDAATVAGKWKLTLRDGKVSEGLFTLLVHKLGHDWRIVHDHSSGKSP
jgi:beta-aspartyl-peptidase (threonine type)